MELDDNLDEYELYINENGVPSCDYKLHRGSNLELKPIQKFQNGINRIIRILKSYKSSSFTDLLTKVQEQVKKERNNKIKRQKSKVKHKNPQTFEERVEQNMLEQSEQIQQLISMVTKQTGLINGLRSCQHFK
jgi:hypothetical protein